MDVRIVENGDVIAIATTIHTTADFSSLVYYTCKEVDDLEYLGPRIDDGSMRVDVFSYKEQNFILARWGYRGDTFDLLLHSANDILNETVPIKNYRYKVIDCIPEKDHLKVYYFKDLHMAREILHALGESAVVKEI